MKMQKAVIVLLTILGVIITGMGLHWKNKKAMSISIIGGADGPTSVFIAGKVGDGTAGIMIGVGVVAVILAVLLLYRQKRK